MAPLSLARARFLLHLAGIIVPEINSVDVEVRLALVAAVQCLVGRQGRRRQIEFAALLIVLEWGTVLFTLRRFQRLSLSRQCRVLRWFESAPLQLLRVGCWGLKALVFAGYYSQEVVVRRVRYRPDFERGNEILRAISRQRQPKEMRDAL
jgi:hypothetical protein